MLPKAGTSLALLGAYSITDVCFGFVATPALAPSAQKGSLSNAVGVRQCCRLRPVVHVAARSSTAGLASNRVPPSHNSRRGTGKVYSAWEASIQAGLSMSAAAAEGDSATESEGAAALLWAENKFPDGCSSSVSKVMGIDYCTAINIILLIQLDHSIAIIGYQ